MKGVMLLSGRLSNMAKRTCSPEAEPSKLGRFSRLKVMAVPPKMVTLVFHADAGDQARVHVVRIKTNGWTARFSSVHAHHYPGTQNDSGVS